MSDLRVDTRAIEAAYLPPSLPASRELWNVTPVWSGKQKGARVLAADNAGAGASRVINGVIDILQAKTMAQHRQAVDIMETSFLWDGPPIRISNKGHLRLAAYLLKYIAHLDIIPVALTVNPVGSGRHLLELDAVAVSHPHRTWLVPASLLLPSEVAKNIHLKIGVNGSLEDGKVELLTGRLTNLPPFLPTALRIVNGIAMGALPHAFEEVLGFAFDFADGGHYYADKRNSVFKSRHPNSTNPTLDYAQDVLWDTRDWLQQQAVVAYETGQASFGRTFQEISRIVSTVINFYLWILNTVWNAVNSATSTAADFVGAAGERVQYSAPVGGGAGGRSAVAAPPAGGGAKAYRGPVVAGQSHGTAVAS